MNLRSEAGPQLDNWIMQARLKLKSTRKAAAAAAAAARALFGPSLFSFSIIALMDIR